MTTKVWLVLIGAAVFLNLTPPASGGEPLTAPSDVSITTDGRLLVNNIPFFLIGTAPGPKADLKTPEGKNGWAELAEGGINVVRGLVPLDENDPVRLAQFEEQLEAAAAQGVYVWPMLRDLVVVSKPKNRERLPEVIDSYKDHPAVLMWKSSDEPEWGKIRPEPLAEAYRMIRELDPRHPVWICQAPRGTTETLAPYQDACDAISIDIYPVGEPPGKHARLENTGLSLVGDFTQRVRHLARPGQMPFMVIQACWSGVLPTHNPKNRLMFPDFRESRYMLYQAFIKGANGVSYFGLTLGLTGRDYDLGFNWTFWRAIIRPLLAEIRPGSELNPVLTAPDTTYPLESTGAPQIETRCKVVGPYVYIFAAAREGGTQEVTFRGLRDGEVAVLHENRFLQAREGAFTDSFAPHDVHIYRATRHVPNEEVKRTRERLDQDARDAAAGKKTRAVQTDIHVPEGAEDTTGTKSK